MPSKSARMKAMVVNRPTCGGPKKAGLVPRSTAFYGRWFMVRKGTNKIDKKKYPRKCQGSGKTLGMRKSAAAAVDYLQKHLAELNARINWNIPGHATLGWPAHMDSRVPVEDKLLAIGAITDIVILLSELISLENTNFWGLQAGNYSGKLARAIKKVNNYLAKQTFNLGPHGIGLISRHDAALLRENGHGGTASNPLMFSFGTFAGKEVEVFSFDLFPLPSCRTNPTWCAINEIGEYKQTLCKWVKNILNECLHKSPDIKALQCLHEVLAWLKDGKIQTLPIQCNSNDDDEFCNYKQNLSKWVNNILTDCIYTDGSDTQILQCLHQFLDNLKENKIPTLPIQCN